MSYRETRWARYRSAGCSTDVPLRRIAHPSGVLELVLDRPSRRNALDDTLSRALVAALADVGDARVVLLRGAGTAFCAGYDLRSVDTSCGDALARSAESRLVPLDPPAPAAVEACAVPVVAALHGAVLGGGLELALACDVRTVADDARLGVPAAQLGLVYSHEGLRRFVRAFGSALARDLLLTGRTLDAVEARRIGIARDGIALDVANAIARHSASAQQGNRRILQSLDAAAGAPLRGAERSAAISARAHALRSKDLLDAIRSFHTS